MHMYKGGDSGIIARRFPIYRLQVHENQVAKMGKALQMFGMKRALVGHSKGLDEMSPSNTTNEVRPSPNLSKALKAPTKMMCFQITKQMKVGLRRIGELERLWFF